MLKLNAILRYKLLYFVICIFLFYRKREIETKNVEQVQKCMELSSKFKDDLAKIKTILSQYAVIVHEKEYGMIFKILFTLLFL